MTEIDPTDHALAAIASILDQPEAPREPEAVPVMAPVVDESPLAPAPIEAAGYSKAGPGPMAAIRFKWTVRRDDDGHFYVDETIGEIFAPIVTGPMSPDDAIRMVDERESEARLRFDQLRAEMTGRAAAAGLVRNDSGEI